MSSNSPSSSRRIDLLVIDPQVDFCLPNGRLYVTGAEHDISRLTSFVRTHGHRLTWLHVTQDSHHRTHIANCINWVDANGNPAGPFTPVSVDDVRNGKWRAKNPRNQPWYQSYVEKLAANNRYPLTLWPPHCVIGTPGHGFVPEFAEAVEGWEDRQGRPANIVTKGSADLTEHYSAVQADVQIPHIPSTKLNTPLVDALAQADDILIAGEALSHCVANTVTDIANAFGNDALVAKFVLLEDCSSPVGAPGCPEMAAKFMQDMTARGMRVAKSTNFF